MTEYDISFSFRRRKDGEESFTEIGVGETNSHSTAGECAHEVLAMIQNRIWDSEQDIDPKDVD